jgi:AraC-like DNA-binding protein
VARLHCVGLRFTPTGARAWLRLPLHELRDRIVPLADICGAQAVRLLDAAADARTTAQRTGRLLDRARAILRDATPPPGGLQSAVAFTLAREGRVTVDSMAGAAGWSARQLERLFLDAVGLPPKAFARVVRFQHAVRDLQRGLPPAQVAASRGFADQSHLAREFKRMAGVPARGVDLGRVAFVQDADGPPPQH